VASSFEQLIFEILATDRNASAAFDRFRGQVDKTSRSVDDNTGKLDRNAKSMDNLGNRAASTTPLLGNLAGSGGMAAMIAAGVALSPVIATVATGVAGFGLAAYGAVAPVLKASQASGGLAANMAKLDPEQQKVAVSLLALGKQYDAFQKALQPTVLSVFGKGIQIAGHLMHDIQPVAQATGKALGVLLDRIDAEFKSGTWQKFFGFMATSAGPDMKLLGNLIIDLAHSLPSLLESLQPVAVGLLRFTDDVLKATGAVADFMAAEEKKGGQQGSFGKQISDFLKYGYGTKYKNQVLAAAAAQSELDNRLKNAGTSTKNLLQPIGAFKSGLQSAKTATQNESAAVTVLTTALKGLNSGLLTTEADQVAWKQAQQAATAAIKANTGSLDSNRSSALAARSAIINSTQAALTFANQEVTVHKNTDAASAIIRAQITYLQQHAGKSKIAAAEIDALRQALAKLPHNTTANVNVHGGGSGSIVLDATGAAAKIRSILAFHAEGGLIKGGTPGRDSVLAALTPGELVVPAGMVRAGAVEHLRGQLPGFATGGFVGTAAEFRGAPPWAAGQAGRWGTSALGPAIGAVVNAVRAALHAAAASQLPSGGGPASGAVGALQRYAASLFPSYGWGPGMIGSLIALWNGESGWNPTARNPSSGAFGIPQALPPGKMGALAASGNAAAQIRWGESYIHSVYGDPMRAYSMWLSRSPHWYDQGGWLPPGVSVAVNNTGRPERVGGGGNTYVIHNHVAPGANLAEVGRVTVEAIRQFEKRSGSGWRR
jgi:hypothetical protein